MRWRRHDGEKGAALVEMAIVLPLLVILVFGIVEYGLLFKEKLTIAAATSSAARTGATMGNREAADFRILQALEAGLFDQVDSKVLISVDIFKANPVTGAKIITRWIHTNSPQTRTADGIRALTPIPRSSEASASRSVGPRRDRITTVRRSGRRS